MRVPYSWLRSYCDPGLPAQEAADRLTMAGDKLERLHRVGVGVAARLEHSAHHERGGVAHSRVVQALQLVAGHGQSVGDLGCT